MDHVSQDWEKLLSYLPATYKELAQTYRLVGTPWPNEKLRHAEDLLRLLFLHVGCDLPLRQSVALLAEAGGPSLSPMRLHKKEVRAAPYLTQLIQELMGTPEEVHPELWCGYDVCSIDATCVTGPGAVGTESRIHTVLRLSNLEYVHVEVTDDSEGESFRRYPWKSGQLAIGDRGYSHPPGIAYGVQQKADVLVRVNRGILPLKDRDGDVFDPLQRALLMEEELHSWLVTVPVKKGPSVEGRLVIARLPEDKAEEARARVRKEHGKKTTKEQLQAADYVLLFTTVPPERMSDEIAMALYRLRWQVELVFKRWKSLLHLDRLPNFRPDTVLTWLLTKILLALLLDRMASDVSPKIIETSGEEVPADREYAGTALPPRLPCSQVERIEGATLASHDRSQPAHGPRRLPPASENLPPFPVRPLSREPWKLTRLLWPILIAAILPLSLAEALPKMGALTARLEATSSTSRRPLQRNAFRALWLDAEGKPRICDSEQDATPGERGS